MNRSTVVQVLVFIAMFIACRSGAAQDDPKAEAVASLVKSLGYGGAIHHFKNYVLRGAPENRDVAEKMFQQASEILVSLEANHELSESEQAAVSAVALVVKDYQAQLPQVQQLREQRKSVEEIDEEVMVDDSAAIAGIAVLREAHLWNDMQQLDFHMGYGSGIHNFKNFVLRADEKYRARALVGLSRVLFIVTRNREAPNLNEQQLSSLDGIESVVRAYETALPKVQVLVGEGKTAQEIDEVVKVDDTPALESMALLRKAKP